MGKSYSQIEDDEYSAILEMRHEALANDGQTAGTVSLDYDLLLWDSTTLYRLAKGINRRNGKITNITSSVSGVIQPYNI